MSLLKELSGDEPVTDYLRALVIREARYRSVAMPDEQRQRVIDLIHETLLEKKMSDIARASDNRIKGIKAVKDEVQTKTVSE